MSLLFSLAFLGVVFVIAMYVANRLPDRNRRAAPRVAQSDLNGFWDVIQAVSVPFATISIGADGPENAAQSRIGGVPFAETGRETWPSGDADGSPKQFFAQINFADLAGLDGFPQKGLLQLFGAVDEHGARDNRVLRLFPDPQGEPAGLAQQPCHRKARRLLSAFAP